MGNHRTMYVDKVLPIIQINRRQKRKQTNKQTNKQNEKKKRRKKRIRVSTKTVYIMKILETNSQEHIAREREREKRERYGGGTRAPKRVHTFKSNRGEGAEKRAGVLFVFIERGIFFKKKTT